MGDGQAVRIPRPHVSAVDAIKAAEAEASKSAKGAIPVEIVWCKASQFHPAIAPAGIYSVGKDDPNEYSWFVTFVYRDAEAARVFARTIEVGEFTSSTVVRIKDDGTVGILISANN